MLRGKVVYTLLFYLLGKPIVRSFNQSVVLCPHPLIIEQLHVISLTDRPAFRHAICTCCYKNCNEQEPLVDMHYRS